MAGPKAKLVLVRESEAPGQVHVIFQQIKQALGLPHVNVIFQAFAAYPVFLELHWNAIKPVLQTQTFFDLAERLRAEAYTRMHNYFRIPDLCARVTDHSFSAGARHELTDAVEIFHYNNP